MNTKDNQQYEDYQLIDCSSCQNGQTSQASVCALCNGTGFGLWLEDTYFYWKGDISYKGRNKKSLQQKIQISVTIVYSILMGLLLLSWLYSIYRYVISFEHFPPSNILENSSLSYAWGSLLVLFYLVYRYIFIREQDVHVLEKSYKTKSTSNMGMSDTKHVHKVNIMDAFDKDAYTALYDAWELAARLKNKELTPIHLLSVLPRFNNVAAILSRLGLSGGTLNDHFSTTLAKFEITQAHSPHINDSFHKVLLLAYVRAYHEGLGKVSVIDLLHALTLNHYDQQFVEIIEDIFEDLEISTDTLQNVIQWMRIKQQLYERYKRFRSLARFKPKGDVNRAMTSIATKTLDMFSEDLTRAAAYEYLMPCIGRKKEIAEIFRVIEGTNKSILLVGNKGIGRGTIIEGIAQLMVTEDVPEILQDKRMVDLSLPHLIGGVQPAGAQERLLHALDEALVSGNIVLSIRNIELMIGITTGGQTSLDLSQVLVSGLKGRRLFALATTDPQTYSRYIENTGIAEAFNVVKVQEMDTNEAIQVLESKVAFIEAQHHVYFSYDALDKAVSLTSRYMHERYLPEKAIDVIQEVAVYVRNNKQESPLVLGEDVASIVANRTNIPVTSITADETEKLLNLESLIHERIVGQEEAVRVVAASLRRARTELRDGKRPIANLLFLGPTGVGKTEVSKTLADIYFGSEGAMLRFDMSEYQEKSSINRLIGTLDTPGHLTDAVRRQPFSLLLFDELEKAHPDILNIFLQMMDDGRLTDGMGRTVDFTNTIIIATSNAGTQFIQDEIKNNTPIERITEVLMRDKLKEYYRPEFLNRFDNIVVFKPLTYNDILKITRLLLKQVQARLELKDIHLTFTDDAVAELAHIGYDPEFGARPLRRAIQERVDNILAEYLLSGKLTRRDSIVFDVDGKVDIKKYK